MMAATIILDILMMKLVIVDSHDFLAFSWFISKLSRYFDFSTDRRREAQLGEPRRQWYIAAVAIITGAAWHLYDRVGNLDAAEAHAIYCVVPRWWREGPVLAATMPGEGRRLAILISMPRLKRFMLAWKVIASGENFTISFSYTTPERPYITSSQYAH